MGLYEESKGGVGKLICLLQNAGSKSGSITKVKTGFESGKNHLGSIALVKCIEKGGGVKYIRRRRGKNYYLRGWGGGGGKI
jgi:hypothetical protein